MNVQFRLSVFTGDEGMIVVFVFAGAMFPATIILDALTQIVSLVIALFAFAAQVQFSLPVNIFDALFASV